MAEKRTDKKLVTVEFKRPCGRYSPGDRAGFEPEKAKELIDRKIAVEPGKEGAGGSKPAGGSGQDGK